MLERCCMRFGRITPVELLVVIAVAGILSALVLTPSVGMTPPLTDGDLDLDGWRPTDLHSAVPSDSIRVRDVDLTGIWTDRIGWLDFNINLLPDGRYDVKFQSHARCGLSGSVQLERSAEYDDGMLLLDRPVRELRGIAYAKLYSVRVKGDKYLVPSPRVTEFDALSDIPYRGVITRISQR